MYLDKKGRCLYTVFINNYEQNINLVEKLISPYLIKYQCDFSYIRSTIRLYLTTVC